eukprot:s2822_g7.t5
MVDPGVTQVAQGKHWQKNQVDEGRFCMLCQVPARRTQTQTVDWQTAQDMAAWRVYEEVVREYVLLPIASPLIPCLLKCLKVRIVLLVCLVGNMLGVFGLVMGPKMQESGDSAFTLFVLSRAISGICHAGIAAYGSVWVDLHAPKDQAASWLGAMQARNALGRDLLYIEIQFAQAETCSQTRQERVAVREASTLRSPDFKDSNDGDLQKRNVFRAAIVGSKAFCKELRHSLTEMNIVNIGKAASEECEEPILDVGPFGLTIRALRQHLCCEDRRSWMSVPHSGHSLSFLAAALTSRRSPKMP